MAKFWPDVDELSGDARTEYEKLPKKASAWQYKGVRQLDEKKLVNSNGMLNIYRPKDEKSVSVLYNIKKNLNLGTLVEQALLEQLGDILKAESVVYATELNMLAYNL